MFLRRATQLVHKFPVSFPLQTIGTQSAVRTFYGTPPAFQEVAEAPKQIDLKPLKLSNELYAVFKIHNRPYLVTKGDKVILPFKLKQADIGDTLNLTDVVTLGSRNYRLVDYPIDSSLYTLKATVLEKTKRAFEVREVTKRRNRKVRHATSKGDLTVIRIAELKVN